MKFDEIQFSLIKRFVQKKREAGFYTKDISNNSEMLEAHGIDPDNPGNYHSIVGRLLGKNRFELRINETGKDSDKGSFWEKCSEVEKTGNSSSSSGERTVSSFGKSADAKKLGPQSASDKPFTARMRLHQSWYRTHVLRLPSGTGPYPNSTSYYGNMLTRKDGEAGKNFLTSEIATVARKRATENPRNIERFRLLHNMLSSQPMCFNLFGPLVKDAELARKLIDTLVSERVARVLCVVIEWAPEPKAEYLADGTSFDAFVEYLDVDGKKYALGIETKLTEPFSLTKVKDEKKYFRWMTLPGALWKESAKDRFNNLAHNQLWRDHLLAFALENHRKSDYAQCRLMLVRHPQDRECASVVETYRSFLKNEDSFIDMPLDRLFKHWNKVSLAQRQKDWLEAFFLRYLDLGKSEPFIA